MIKFSVLSQTHLLLFALFVMSVQTELCNRLYLGGLDEKFVTFVQLGGRCCLRFSFPVTLGTKPLGEKGLHTLGIDILGEKGLHPFMGIVMQFLCHNATPHSCIRVTQGGYNCVKCDNGLI